MLGFISIIYFKSLEEDFFSNLRKNTYKVSELQTVVLFFGVYFLFRMLKEQGRGFGSLCCHWNFSVT